MRNTILIGALLGAVLAAVGPAAAAKPHGGARYLGFEGSESVPTVRQVSAKARVSADGGEFIPTSYVRVAARLRARHAGPPDRLAHPSRAFRQGQGLGHDPLPAAGALRHARVRDDQLLGEQSAARLRLGALPERRPHGSALREGRAALLGLPLAAGADGLPERRGTRLRAAALRRRQHRVRPIRVRLPVLDEQARSARRQRREHRAHTAAGGGALRRLRRGRLPPVRTATRPWWCATCETDASSGTSTRPRAARARPGTPRT